MLSRRLFNKVLLGGILFPCLPKLNLCKPKITKVEIISNFELEQTFCGGGPIYPFEYKEPERYAEISYSDGTKTKYKYKSHVFSLKNNIPYGRLNFTKCTNSNNSELLVYHDKKCNKLYIILKYCIKYSKSIKEHKGITYITCSGLEAVK